MRCEWHSTWLLISKHLRQAYHSTWLVGWCKCSISMSLYLSTCLLSNINPLCYLSRLMPVIWPISSAFKSCELIKVHFLCNSLKSLTHGAFLSGIGSWHSCIEIGFCSMSATDQFFHQSEGMLPLLMLLISFVFQHFDQIIGFEVQLYFIFVVVFMLLVNSFLQLHKLWLDLRRAY